MSYKWWRNSHHGSPVYDQSPVKFWQIASESDTGVLSPADCSRGKIELGYRLSCLVTWAPIWFHFIPCESTERWAQKEDVIESMCVCVHAYTYTGVCVRAVLTGGLQLVPRTAQTGPTLLLLWLGPHGEPTCLHFLHGFASTRPGKCSLSLPVPGDSRPLHRNKSSPHLPPSPGNSGVQMFMPSPACWPPRLLS